MSLMDKIRGMMARLSREAKAGADHTPSLVTHRSNVRRAAIVFVHGFHGDALATWTSFVQLLLADSRLDGWDVYSAGYPSTLSIDLPIWTSDPELRLAATGLSSKARLAPLERYEALALVAHSMGGLLVQRAILDDPALRQRLSHVLLYGTPSNGLIKAGLGRWLKQQTRDMEAGRPFITELRSQWSELVGEPRDFVFKVIAGDTDAFVPAESSIYPFPKSQQEVVPGNHLQIVRPALFSDPSYEVFYKSLSGSGASRDTVESARLAVEHKDFQRAIDLLLPGAEGLDANSIVTLALALESEGRSHDALSVIQRWNVGKSVLDPIGVLAGRLKRRWLVNHQQRDFDRALSLYEQGLAAAEVGDDHAQAYYHAINIAFLRLAWSGVDDPVPTSAQEMAQCALEHVKSAGKTSWSVATEGEARLILGDLERATLAYRSACQAAKTLRDRESMYIQAVSVAGRIFGDEGEQAIDAVFGRK